MYPRAQHAVCRGWSTVALRSRARPARTDETRMALPFDSTSGARDPRALAILARTIYRELRSSGYEERDVMALADAMTRDVQVPDALFAPLLGQFDAKTLTELVALIAAYNMVSRFLEAMNIGH